MRLPVRALALLLLACNPTKTDDTSPEGDTDVGDLSDLDWRLHQDVQSLVYVSWSQSAAATVHVEYDFEEGERLETPSFEAEAGTHEQLVLGVPFGTDAEWSVVLEGGVSADGETITTGPLPNGLLVPTVHVNETDQQLASGNYLLSSINVDGGWNDGNFWTFILDRQGRAVWASLAPRRHWTLFAQVAASGDHILWDEATYWSNVGLGEESKVHRTWLDSEIDVIDTPGLHHAFVQLPDGTLAWGSKAHGGVEALVEKALDGEDETVIWTCRDDWEGSGHCESNGIFYSADRDSFLYSFYTNDSVVEVDHATGASVCGPAVFAAGTRSIPASPSSPGSTGSPTPTLAPC